MAYGSNVFFLSRSCEADLTYRRMGTGWVMYALFMDGLAGCVCTSMDGLAGYAFCYFRKDGTASESDAARWRRYARG